MEIDRREAAPQTASGTGYIDTEPARALAGLLDLNPAEVLEGPLPLLWHWVYLLDRPAQRALGHDGHPLSGTIPLPPGPGRRRMFAGGRVTAFGPLSHGSLATRRSSILSTEQKVGRNGNLTFVSIAHDIEQAGQVVVRDEQDIVYLDALNAPPPSPVLSAAPPPEDSREIVVDSTLLFRFSALTYNAHRIHYDRDYARTIEGYPGLVVHGPLQALVMSEAARDRSQSRRPCQFTYRLVSPLFDSEGMFVHVARDGDGMTTTVCARSGRTTAKGRLSW